MSTKEHTENAQQTEAGRVEEMAHTHVADCYQCGKCTAGCPMAEVMDVRPHTVIRLLQGGNVDKARQSEAVWQCVSCLTCSTRCPQSVKIAECIDALRQLSIEKGDYSPAQMRTIVFQEAFLSNIRSNGRLFELNLVQSYKMNAFFRDLSIPLLMKDSLLAPLMIRRHKLHFKAGRVKDRGIVKRIFERCGVK